LGYEPNELPTAPPRDGDNAIDYGKYFDSVSICLSKGLGAPVGSVLVCKKELEPKARRMRKAFGGGMRQAGFLAAAASYALDNHVNRLKEDHTRARVLGKELGQQGWVKSVMPVDTNIVIFSVVDSTTPENILAQLNNDQVKAIKFGPQEIRLVTHLDFDDKMLDKNHSGV
jgi:threonine aldolase